MAVVAAIVGSCLTCAFAVVISLWLYMKHRRRHVKDLRGNLEDLEGQASGLRVTWNNKEKDIDRRAASVRRGRKYEAWKKVVTRLLDDYNKIIDKHKNMTGATGNQRGQEAEGSNRADVNERSTNASIPELRDISHLGEHKLCTTQFFELARLDKDVIKLKDKFTSARGDLGPADLTSPVNPKAVIRMGDAKDLHVVPSHQVKLKDLLRACGVEDKLIELLCACGVEADAEADAVPSHENTLHQLLVELKPCEVEVEAKLKRIAIYGEAQVGKTNIMKNLNNWFDSCPPSAKLDYVIWVTVPTNLHEKEDVIKTIQGSILRRLELTKEIDTIDKNKDTISTELREKSYLLLFEGFSSLIQLGEIGVSEEHKHGIVVIETKDPVLLRNFDFDQEIKVKKLPDPDSRKLFDKIMEGKRLSKECRDLVQLILKQLGGLPGVISFIATLLKRNIDAQYWRGIKNELTAAVGHHEDLGLGGLIKAFEIAYENLKEDRCKSCLLYAALFPKEVTIPINVLVECWKAEDFLRCPTFLRAREDGTVVRHNLTEHCLLENCSEQYVKLPIFFTKFAIRRKFPGKDGGISFVGSGPEIQKDLTNEGWKEASRVSLKRSELEGCRGISTLFLELNPTLTIIGEKFFTSMTELRVLDLHSTGIKSLPPSISSLTELRSLYLNNCGKLTELPPEIEKLTNLEVLDIRDTSIHCLPEVISSLVGLRCLRFSFDPEACNPNPEPRWWGRLVRLPFASKPERTWLIFAPGTADQLNKLEELTIVLVNQSHDGIVDGIKEEVHQFENKNKEFKFDLRPSQSLDQPNQSVPPSHVDDPTPGNQSPRSVNEGRSRGGTTGANSQARKKEKGKGPAIFKPKTKTRIAGPLMTNRPLRISGPSETNRSRADDIHEETNEIVDRQADRATVDAIELSKISARTSTSGTAGGED